MLNSEDNDLLTRVGPGTPAGEMLRRYWHPVAAACEITADKPKKRIRLLGEDLVLFRDGSGALGLIEEHCPHRGVSLYYGFVENEGIRCPYHGWKFDCQGQCLEMPFEPEGTPLKSKIVAKTYKVQELSGLLFAYLGPDPAPLLPHYDPLVRTDVRRKIHILPLLDCNWLQVMENSVDPTHTHYLHGANMNARGSEEASFHYRKIEAIDFVVRKEADWGGVIKKRVFGDVEIDSNEGHPVIFPTMLLLPPHPHIMMHFRVPVDDTHTQIFRCQFTESENGEEIKENEVPVEYVKPFVDDNGEYHLTTFGSQDAMAWETQGAIANRSREMLGASDRGIALYRRLLKEQIAAVQQGKDPLGVIRDPAINKRIMIALSAQQQEFRNQRLKNAKAEA
jgi:5,5'-dehydrodivanillate O-demethylase oxygenase subunit